jgi:hypothetical protein
MFMCSVFKRQIYTEMSSDRYKCVQDKRLLMVHTRKIGSSLLRVSPYNTIIIPVVIKTTSIAAAKEM